MRSAFPNYSIDYIHSIRYCVLKHLYMRCCKTKPINLAINEQNDEIDKNNDNNITEVNIYVLN